MLARKTGAVLKPCPEPASRADMVVREVLTVLEDAAVSDIVVP